MRDSTPETNNDESPPTMSRRVEVAELAATPLTRPAADAADVAPDDESPPDPFEFRAAVATLAPFVVAAGAMEANAATAGAPKPEATSAVSAAALESAVAALSALPSSARPLAAVEERSAFSAGALAAPTVVGG